MNYVAFLESCWQEHLQPRAENAPKVISTFAGCGGSSLGYSMAGFRELLAVEWDNNAVETFRLNFHDVPVYHGDIAKLSVQECLDLAKIQPRELDVFDGSPPCQGFSTAGKRMIDDPRNQLFREYVRLLRGLQPKVFVMENVSGMVKGKMKLVFVEILQELKASGYQVSARLLNAVYFTVPQSRERMIFIGVRNDLNIAPSHPKAENNPITAFCALDRVKRNQDEITFLLDAGRKYRAYKYWDFVRVGHSEDEITGSGFNAVKFNPNKPASTIRKNDGNLTMHGAMHWGERRRFSENEFMRFSSFPDAFVFARSKRWGDSVNRIGNSVPPLFMRSIARHIRREILDKI